MEFTDSGHMRSMFGVSRSQAYQFAQLIADFSVAEAVAISTEAAAVAREKAEELRRKTLLSLEVIANGGSDPDKKRLEILEAMKRLDVKYEPRQAGNKSNRQPTWMEEEYEKSKQKEVSLS